MDDFAVVTVSPQQRNRHALKVPSFSIFWKGLRGGCGRRAERPAIPGHRSAGEPAPLRERSTAPKPSRNGGKSYEKTKPCRPNPVQRARAFRDRRERQESTYEPHGISCQCRDGQAHRHPLLSETIAGRTATDRKQRQSEHIVILGSNAR